MHNTKWLALGLVVALCGLALAADPKPAVPPPQPRKVLTGPELVEEIATTMRAIFPNGKEPSPQQFFLLVGELLELHNGKQPTPEEVTAMVADVKTFKPRPKSEDVLAEVAEMSPAEITPSIDLAHPVLRMSTEQMKELLDSLNGV